MIRIIICGCNGHMGQTVTRIAGEREDTEVVAGIDKYKGVENKYPVFDDLGECDVKADAIIDFSAPAALTGLLEYGRKTGTPLIICSTGYTKEQIAEIDAASKEVAILRSANMSLGVNVLAKLITQAVKELAPAGFDVEIVEKHHNLKKDAPSGTALYLADAVNEGADGRYRYVYDRSQRSEKRPQDEIGISAVRGGNIPGDHDVIFAGEDEVVTFSHRAYSKAVFARGAVQAAVYMCGKGPGMYSMQDVIG
ncbi:MAG: 4-hydroxy-tetrahydrodipicolinate reductase [Lachnospiraceae bacterium]|nr:4-hydroxy-tetrahydrodipicolinate reductase [Lachnospiraceae bacterium]MBQ5533993.1 4-hydroxy-tetrahydrodipicolinate reductase [Lachnospiraceae bacterium]